MSILNNRNGNMCAAVTATIAPSRTVVTSFNPRQSCDYSDRGDYVLCVATSEERQSIGCALSNSEIQIYDQNTLHRIHSYQRNDSLVTEMTFDTFDPNLLAATANDGSLTLYDIRLPMKPAIAITNTLRPGEEALSVSMGFDGKIAAVGSSKKGIHFYDIRETRGSLGIYSNSHKSEVTRVRFQRFNKSTTPMLVSGSEDGLACIFDTSKTTEESAIQNILTVHSPIREVGFFGPNFDDVYCLTGSESLKLYHKDDTLCRQDYGNTREYLNSQLIRHGQPIGPIDYLVDCHWDSSSQELLMLCGSSKGDSAMFVVGDREISPRYYLKGGHRGVIRAWSYSNIKSSFLTVGEDARMCEWERSPSKSLGNQSDKNQIVISRKRQGDSAIEKTARQRMTIDPY